MAFGCNASGVIRGSSDSQQHPSPALEFALGLALGVVGAALLGQTLKSQLFEISPWDPSSYAAMMLILLAVASAAILFPALRAGGVSPLEALRQAS